MVTRTVLDLLGEAGRSLRGRIGRTLLMATGPLLAVTVIVGSLGVLASTTGQLRADLARLGADLVVVEDQGSGSFLPEQAVDRIAQIPTVAAVAASSVIPGVFPSPTQPTPFDLPDGSGTALAAHPNLAHLFGIDVVWGRSLTVADQANATTAVVVGADLAARYGLRPHESAVIYVGPHRFGVVGVLESGEIGGSLNQSVLIPPTTAQRLFGIDDGWQQLQVLIEPDDVAATVPILVDVATRGAPTTATPRVPTDLLAAQAAVDITLAGAVVALGGLVLLVGGFGIANVMLLSVLERRREIGTRRALGHPRSIIAGQFIAETLLIGTIGAIIGAIAGVAATHIIAGLRGWIAVIHPQVVALAMIAAIAITTLAGLYPALKAARLEPLNAIRAD